MKEKGELHESCQREENDKQERIIELEADHQDMYSVRAHTHTHSPMNAAVAHDDVRGSQTRAELRGHSEQPHSWSPAGCVLTGGSAATTDKTLHQTVELLQSVQGTHQLGRHRRRGFVQNPTRGRKKTTSKLFMSKAVHKKSRSAECEVLVLSVRFTVCLLPSGNHRQY